MCVRREVRWLPTVSLSQTWRVGARTPSGSSSRPSSATRSAPPVAPETADEKLRYAHAQQRVQERKERLKAQKRSHDE